MQVLLETKKSALIKLPYLGKNIYDHIKALPLETHEITIYGKKLKERRESMFFSDVIKEFNYSNAVRRAHPLTDELRELLHFINDFFQEEYNGILLNYYKDGSSVIGAHSDNQDTLGRSGVVSISFGATRKFRIRDRAKKIVGDFTVSNGEILFMQGDFQKEFTHEIPAEKKVTEGRYSVTFRRHPVSGV